MVLTKLQYVTSWDEMGVSIVHHKFAVLTVTGFLKSKGDQLKM